MCLFRACAELNTLLHSGHSLGLEECVSGCLVSICCFSSASEQKLLSHSGQRFDDNLILLTLLVTSSNCAECGKMFITQNDMKNHLLLTREGYMSLMCVVLFTVGSPIWRTTSL